MTTTTEYPPYLATGEDARDHPADGINPEFSDGPGIDPKAPYGRKADGTPKAKPGRPAGTPDKNPRTRTTQRRRTMTAAPPKRREPKKSGRPAVPDYRPGILGITQVIAAPLMVAGLKSPVLAADAAAITLHAEPLADALQATAEQVPQFAAALDKVLTVGPYGALLAAVLPLAVQVMANHRVIPEPAAHAMGAMTPDELMEAFAADAQQQAA
jgi:hypothetical protein